MEQGVTPAIEGNGSKYARVQVVRVKAENQADAVECVRLAVLRDATRNC
jgi:hypothetical protein